MFLCNMDDEGIVILPTHRGIHSVPGFSAEEFAARVGSLVPLDTRQGRPRTRRGRSRRRDGKGRRSPGAPAPAGLRRLVPRPGGSAREPVPLPARLRTLDVVILHGFLSNGSWGSPRTRSRRGGSSGTTRKPGKPPPSWGGELQAAFFLNPVTMEEFRDVSLSGHVLPQKTTFFYPKILTGLLISPCGEMTRCRDRGGAIPPLRVRQPEKGYRFSIDSVLLADFARRCGRSVLDLGTGSGVVLLLLARRCDA